MPKYNIYDHRIKQMIVNTGNPDLFVHLSIPRSTALTWIRKGVRQVITFDELDEGKESLIKENAELKHQLEKQIVRNHLVIFIFRIFGLQIQYKRLPQEEFKETLLEKIKLASQLLPLKECLDAIGLTAARYHNWIKRQVKCLLDDQTSCPRLSPSKLTIAEINAIKDLVTDKAFSHFPIPSLAWLARRNGKVFASISTWYRIIKTYNIGMSIKRIYPAKPRIGIRATAPNQIWHIDQTILRLENNTKIFIQAIIDNSSRYILAWKATLQYGGVHTRALIEKAILQASGFYPDMVPAVWMDSGCENLNKDVDQLVKNRAIDRIVAQIDLVLSNSMIERFFLDLKHRWLFLMTLPSFDAVQKALETYMYDYCHKIPKDVLGGTTPFEAFCGTWNLTQLSIIEQAGTDARRNRKDLNKSYLCGACSI